MVSEYRDGQDIHVICDDVSSHKAAAVQAFLGDHASVTTRYYTARPRLVSHWALRKIPVPVFASRAICARSSPPMALTIEASRDPLVRESA